MNDDADYSKIPDKKLQYLLKMLTENPDNIGKLTLLEVMSLIDKGKFDLDINLDFKTTTLYVKFQQKKTNKEELI